MLELHFHDLPFPSAPAILNKASLRFANDENKTQKSENGGDVWDHKHSR